MSTPFNRRDFIKTTGAAALAATVLPVWAQDAKKITVAFVGVAHIHTPHYLDLVKSHPGTQIKYVWDHDADRAARRAKEAGATVPADLNAIWSDPEIPRPIATMIWCWRQPRRAKIYMRKNRWASPRRKAVKWRRPSKLPE